MADASNTAGRRADEQYVSDDQGNGVNRSRVAAQPLPIKKAALYGALLGGLIALMQGLTTLAAFGVSLERVGFFATPAIEMGFAGRSVLALVLTSVVVAAAGAGVWALGALAWNRHAAYVTDRDRSQRSRAT